MEVAGACGEKRNLHFFWTCTPLRRKCLLWIVGPGLGGRLRLCLSHDCDMGKDGDLGVVGGHMDSQQ
jgi:hypothetical protein